ncbi:MAG: hypothetical protein ABIJ27_08025 [Candidatus Omnitrophota bacterium]
MKKRTLFLIILLPLIASGCKIDFKAQTVVDSDGTVTRTTRYVADSDTDKNELLERYDLPPGGVWTTEDALKYDWSGEKEIEGVVYVYEATGRFAPGEEIRSDYIRKAVSAGSRSSNEIRLTVHDLFFMKTYDYQERFFGLADKKKAEAAISAFFGLFAEHLTEEVARELEGEVDPAQAAAAVHNVYGPLKDKFMEAFRREDSIFTSEVFTEELAPALESGRIVSDIVSELFSADLEESDPRREAVERAMESSEEDMEGYWEDAEREGYLFGPYGFFQTYGFNVSLSLPGTVTGTNAHDRNGNVLSWAFTTSDFQWRDYVLEGRSRIIYPLRLAMLVFLIIIFTAVVWFRRRK